NLPVVIGVVRFARDHDHGSRLALSCCFALTFGQLLLLLAHVIAVCHRERRARRMFLLVVARLLLLFLWSLLPGTTALAPVVAVPRVLMIDAVREGRVGQRSVDRQGSLCGRRRRRIA